MPKERPFPKLDTRRRPRQARGLKRREEILDATARLLERVGPEGTNTGSVALEAGASIGTVYEYFPNRDALVRALLERYRARLRAVMGSAFANVQVASWQTVARAAVDSFAAFYREEPGYRVLWLESQTSPALREAGADWGDEFTDTVGQLFALVAPEMTAATRNVVARVAVHLVSALTSLALAGPKRLADPLLEETKLALESYLERALRP